MLQPFAYDPPPLAPGEVEIAIHYCGICHSDVHLVDGDWGDFFPLVPGHEIIGTVVAGEGVPVGTRVGVGWQCGSCGTCEWCAEGEERLCAANQATCMGRYGGFADRIRVDHRFAIPIPDGLEGASAAPLLCGGITVFTPLCRYAREGSRVAVVGIGGLGHLGLRFAAAMGCEVTAISTRPDKEKEARGFGAHHFLIGDPPPGAFDLILNTAHFAPRMDVYLQALRPKGVFCQLGAAAEPLVVPSFGLIVGSKTVSGSAIGSPGGIAEMLRFAALHGIGAQVEVMPMERCNEALDRTRRNQARYRMVLARC
jgi:uncharacterized zinc-type alcohol dehydrogenase-like protein